MSTVSGTNLLPGDTDLEYESRSMTQGTWGSSIHGNSERLTFSIDRRTGYSGTTSVRMNKPGEVSTLEVALPLGKHTFSFYAKSDKADVAAYIGAAPFRRSTWPTRLQKRKKIILNQTWQRYTYTFNSDGKEKYVPGFSLESENSTAWFDAFMLNTGTAPEAWVKPPDSLGIDLPLAQGNVYTLGVSMNIFINATREPQVEIVDAYGKVEKIKNLRKIAPKRYCFNYLGNKRGWFAVKARIGNIEDYQTFIVVDSPVKIISGIEPFCAMCGAQDFPEAAWQIGVKWIELYADRFYAAYHKGKKWDYDFLLNYSLADKFIKQGFAIKTLFSFNVPEWMRTNEEKAIAKKYKLTTSRFLPRPELLNNWREFVADFMKKHGKKSLIYELGGELDALYGLNPYYKEKYRNNIIGNFACGPVADQLSDLIKAGCEEIRKVVPEARISTIRPSDVDARNDYLFSAEILKRCGKNINWLGLDCYPQPRWIGRGQPAPELEKSLDKNIKAGIEKLQKYGADTKVFVSEYGYFIEYEKWLTPEYQRIQANRLARSFIQARHSGAKSFFYYSANYPANTLEADKFTMSLWLRGNPSIALAAYSAVAKIVENVVSSEELKYTKNLSCFNFTYHNGSGAIALWSTDMDYRPKIKLNSNGITATDFLGNPYTPTDGNFIIEVGEEPIYFHAEKKKIIDQAFKSFTVHDDIPAQIFLRPAERNRLKAYIVNNSEKNLHSGKIEFYDTVRFFIIPPGEMIIVNLPLTPVGKKVKLNLIFDGEYKPWTIDWETPKITSVAKNPTSISLSTRDKIMPVDHTTWFGADDLSINYKLSADDTNLYVEAQVTDDKHFNNYSGKNIFKGDCLQLAFDPETNRINKTNGMDLDDTTLTIALANGKPAMAIHHSPYPEALAKMTKYSVIRQTDKTIYKVALPLNLIGKNMKKGRIFGYNAVVFDDDSGSNADYWMQISHGLAGGQHPEKYQLFILE